MFRPESSPPGSVLGQIIFLDSAKTRLEAELYGNKIVQLTKYPWYLTYKPYSKNAQIVSKLEVKK